MMRSVLLVGVVLLSLLVRGPLSASAQPAVYQVDCPAKLQAAIEQTNTVCVQVGRNQICFGSGTVKVQGGGDATFVQPGDIIDAASVESITLESTDDAVSVALLRLALNLPDELADQFVTVLLVGDVTLTNNMLVAAPVTDEPVEEAAPAPTLTLTAGSTVNVRSGPSTSDAIVGTVSGAVTADGRLADNTWLHVQLADGGTGWVFAELVTVDGDVNTLNVLDPATVPASNPVDAGAPATDPLAELQTPLGPFGEFTLQTGEGSSACAGQIPSGALIQTPDGLQTEERLYQVQFKANGANVTMGSTAWVTTDPVGMAINVLEHYANVTNEDGGAFAPAGSEISIPKDGAPQAKMGVVDEALQELMDALGDGEEVTLPRSTPKNPPSSDTEPESWEGDMQLIDGFYAYMTLGTLSAGEMCPNFGSMAGTDVITLDDKLNVDENNRLLAWIMQDGSLLPFNRPMANYYIGSVDDGFGVTQIVIEVDSVLFMEGILSISGPGCTMNTPFLIVSCMWDVVQGVPAKADGVCPADVRDTMLKN